MGDTINISTNPNKYNEDYTNIPDDAVVRYGSDWDMVCSKEEFIRYQKALLELKNKYNFSELSPVEKIMAAYNLVKQKPFHQTGDETLNGLPHASMFSENIDCRGYCTLMMELLAGEGITVKPLGLDVFDKEGNLVDRHQRLTVLIDDPKYGINGLYVCAPSEDSYKPEYQEYFEGMEPTDLYCSFLKPINEPSLYSDDNYEYRISYAAPTRELSTKPFCYDNPATRVEYLVENYDPEEISFFLEDALEGVLEGKSKEEMLNYIRTNYLSFDTLMEIIGNIKRNEGLSEEKIQEDINRISNINEPFFIKGNEGKTL